jgi:hypothetical protein
VKQVEMAGRATCTRRASSPAKQTCAHLIQTRHREGTHADADIAKGLTMDEARRVAANIVKLPTLLKANNGPFGRHPFCEGLWPTGYIQCLHEGLICSRSTRERGLLCVS